MDQIGDVGRLISVHVEEKSRMGVRRGEGGKIVRFLWPCAGVGAGRVVWTYPIRVAGKVVFGACGSWRRGGVLGWIRMQACPVSARESNVDLHGVGYFV